MARIGILALLIAGLLGACASPSTGATTKPSVGVSALPSSIVSSLPSTSALPSEVAGLPVISVASAEVLLRSGKLDGQAVAVAGYYNAVALPCPYPGRYIGPLEQWCMEVAFTDTRTGATLCQSSGANGTSCGQPSGTNLVPFFMTETSGDPGSWLGGSATGPPVAMVLIGHGGDARQWQCPAATQVQCAHAFVVDRIASADGHAVPPAAPPTGDQQTGRAITPRMTLAQVAASIGVGDDLLTGAALPAGDIATVDPRWNLAGSEIVWLARSLGPAAQAESAQTRSETVWLVDDTTGKVMDSKPLKQAPDYQPARLWQMATAHGVDCCAADLAAFYRVESSDGTLVHEGLVPGGESGGNGSTTFGGGYGSGPLVLPAGAYSITAWLATNNAGVMGSPHGECASQVTLRPLDDIALNADFPPDKACSLQPAPSPSPGG